MSKQKPAALALGTALAGLTLTGAAFAMQPLAQGYMLAAGDAAKAQEGKCGEGKCGIEKVDTDKDGRVSQAEFVAAHPDKADQFAKIDANQDGFIDEAERKAHHAAKGTEGKCGEQAGDKKAGEGKCGEGKCGEGKCGGMA
ncbi:HvfA family oxazolone/thioamide-modified RiPP metallophore [Pseudoxanthomonas suwonensis]|uniref:EF-hand domain-containing protein n=1 Tax=Pseudoxanthomonas suwonensis TaxID=314722 RepID=A0A0E3UNX1_9GAMM|nr:hypothetical protein [Pseudoxanthomonas suwonensis]AKC87526.1 hypothetical protein WQ53_12950 [Pseudoxanthomonas suwonensis]